MLYFNIQLASFFEKFIIFINIYSFLCNGCPKSNSTDNLGFLENMKQSILADFHKSAQIDCCVTGFKTIEWQFQTSGSEMWSNEIPGNPEFIDQRTILFKSVEKINSGTYKCKSGDGRGNVIEGNTTLVVGCTSDDSDLSITYETLKTSFMEHENGKFCCNLSTINDVDVIFTYWKSDTHSTLWNNILWIKEISKNVSEGRFSIFMKMSSINKICEEIISAETCLIINDIQKTDSGYYECYFQRISKIVKTKFKLNIIPNKSYIIWYSSCSALVALIILKISIIIWLFYYDLIIIRTKCCHSKLKCHKIDTLIIYDDKDASSISTAMKISENLSNEGFSTFIYDRDKKYGTEFHEVYLTSMAESNEILFILSEKSWDNELLLFCLNNSTQYKQRRIFAFLYSKKLTLKSLKCKPEMTQILQIIQTSKNYKIWKANYVKDSFMGKRFIKWIISGLPYNAFKRARNHKVLSGVNNPSFKM